MRIVLGNRDAAYTKVTELEDHEVGEDGVRVRREMVPLHALRPVKLATVIDVDDDNFAAWDTRTLLRHVALDTDSVWNNHCTPGATPAWVAAEDPVTAQALSLIFGGIEIRTLEDVVSTVDSDGNPLEGVDPKATANGSVVASVILMRLQATLIAHLPTVLLTLWMLFTMSPHLKTNIGNDVQARQMASAGSTASATAVLKFMALTANASAAAAGDTTLTAEIATASGGLIRQTATPAHTTSASTYTLTGTFTANGNDSLPVTIAKMGVFDASSTGNMGFETLVSPTATLSASGDVLTVTQTVTM